jgi:hypothetical protein
MAVSDALAYVYGKVSRRSAAPSATVKTQAPASGGDEFVPTPRDGWHAPLELIGHLFDKERSAEAVSLIDSVLAGQQADGGWKEDEHASASNLDSSVLNHIAVAKALRRETFSDDAERTTRMQSALQNSWLHLANRIPTTEARQLDELPGSVTRRLSQGPALMHATLLGHSVAVRVDRQACLDEATSVCQAGARGEVLEAQPRHLGRTLAKVGLVGALAVGAAACPHALLVVAAWQTAQFATGLVVGQINSSLNETFGHDYLLHASKPLRNKAEAWMEASKADNGPLQGPVHLAQRIGLRAKAVLGKGIIFGHYSHSTHHSITDGKNYEEKLQVDSPRKQQVMARLAKDGRLDLEHKKFGSTTDWLGYAFYQVTALPSYIACGVAAYALGAGPAFALGFAIPSALEPTWSKDYHDWVHTKAKDIVTDAPPLIREYMKTWPSRHIVGLHYRHHVWKPRETRDCNYDLGPFPIGDWMRGKYIPPTPREEEDMGDRGLFYW